MEETGGMGKPSALHDLAANQLLQSGIIPYYVLDAEGIRIDLNPAARNLFQFDTTEGQVFHQRIDPVDFKSYQKKLRHALINRESYSCRYKFQRSDGVWILVGENGQAIVDNQQRSVGIAAVCTDLSRHHELEEELKVSLEMARFPMDDPNPVFRIDQQGQVLFANHASTELLKKLGIRQGSLQDHSFLDFVQSRFQSSATAGIYTIKLNEHVNYALNVVCIPEGGYANVYVSDISELVEVQSRLRQKVADLRAALDSTDYIMILLDEHSQILEFNTLASTFFTQSLRTTLSYGASFKSCLDPNAILLFEEKFNQVVQLGETLRFELDLQPYIKKKMILQTVLNPVFDIDTKAFMGLCISLKDITESKSELLQLESQKEFYETILDNIPADIAIFDDKHQYVYVNPQGIKDVNLRKWMIGKTDYDYCRFRGIGNQMADERRILFQDVLQAKTEKQIETEHVMPNGDVKYMLRKFYPYYKNGAFKLMIGYGVDISETKRAHRSLSQSEHRYRTLFENNPLMGFILDKAGNILSLNASVIKELDYPEGHLIDRPLINLFPEINRDEITEHFNACFEAPDREFGWETRITKKSGKLIEAEIRAKVIYSEKGAAQLLLIANNITHRKQNERLLEESEKLNRRLIQELPLPIGIIQGNHTILSNDAYRSLIQWRKGESEESPPFGDYVIPDDRPIQQRANDSLLRGNEVVDYTVRISPTPGIVRHVSIRDSLFNYKNQLVTLSLMNDITENVMIEKKNKEIEERTRLIIDSALDAVVITDLFGKILDWNRQAQNIFGWTSAEAQNLKLEEIILPEKQTRRIPDPIRPEKVTFTLNHLLETYGVNSSGRKFPIELFIAQIEIPEQKLFAFYIRDVSVRKLAEMRIQETERIENILTTFSADSYLIETIPGVLEKLVETFNTICNKCQIAIYLADNSRKSLMLFHTSKTSDKFQDSLHELEFGEGLVGDAAEQRKYLQVKDRMKDPVYNSYQPTEGSELAAPLLVNDQVFAVLHYQSKTVDFFVDSNLSIIRKLFDTTSTRIAKIMDEQSQIKMTRELVRNNAQLQQYSYIVSHNLRAPIANLLGLSKIFNRQNLGDPRNMMILQNIEASANNIDNVLRDLNEILSIKKDINKSKEYVVFDEVLDTVLKGLEREIQSIKPIITLDMEAPGVISIKPYITSIFANLIGNSLKYHKKDRETRITVRSRTTDRAIVLEFEDNGIGIDLEKHRDKVFGLYKRFHMHVEGTGIGLHLVKSQVEALGGHISVTSQVDHGTTFTLEFYHE